MADAETRTRSTGFLVAAALAAVFFASTVLLGVVAVGLKSDKDELADARGEVAAAAGRFVEELLGYDYRDPDGYRDRVLALTAAPFDEQFATAVDGLEESFDVAQAVSVGTVRDVFVAEIGDDATALAIVVYDRTLDGTAGPRRERNLYVRLGLEEQDGTWRINDVVNLSLAFTEGVPGQGGGATTTSTTGPVTTAASGG